MKLQLLAITLATLVLAPSGLIPAQNKAAKAGPKGAAEEAAFRKVYEVRDILEISSALKTFYKNAFRGVDQNAQATDGAAMLVQLVLNCIDLRPEETVEVLNGSRLAVYAAPGRQKELGGLLGALRRSADVGVVMNARLYEVDRAFFAREMAPLFTKGKDTSTVARIDDALLRKINGQKIVLQSEDVKIRPEQAVVFLSHQNVFRYAAGPVSKGAGLEGVSFRVRPRVSADRRYLRLEITQDSVQLAGINKVKEIDLSTGKEVEAEAPNVHRTSVTGTVQILDANPILMAVNYRPSGKDKAEKVWLLVARPFIWIEEEVRIRRRGGGDLTPQAIWEAPVSKEDEPAAGFRDP